MRSLTWLPEPPCPKPRGTHSPQATPVCCHPYKQSGFELTANEDVSFPRLDSKKQGEPRDVGLSHGSLPGQDLVKVTVPPSPTGRLSLYLVLCVQLKQEAEYNAWRVASSF